MTHRCERARAGISLELDGELSQVELAFLERHLSRCATCTDFRAESLAFTGALRSAPLDSMARSAAELTHRRRGRRRALPRTAVVAASFAAVAVGGLYGLGQVEQVQPKSAPAGSVRPAYLDSPDFELALLRPARANRGTSTVAA
jgi:predicted anti-sigma-YlaC factor YlaD